MQQAVRKDLDALKAQVAVREHQRMLLPVHARATRIGEFLLRSLERPAPPASTHSAAALYHDAVRALVAFVTTFSKTDKFVFHLASIRRMYLDLHVVGSKLDQVVQVLEDDSTKTTWQTQLKADREQEEEALSARAAKNALPFPRSSTGPPIMAFLLM